jgi:hypothetical protein
MGGWFDPEATCVPFLAAGGHGVPVVCGLGVGDLNKVPPPDVFAIFATCASAAFLPNRLTYVLTCQSIMWIGLDRDHALWARHLHHGIGSVDDLHKFQEEMPLEDAVVADVKASHLKREHLLMLVVSYSTGYLTVDVSDRSG